MKLHLERPSACKSTNSSVRPSGNRLTGVDRNGAVFQRFSSIRSACSTHGFRRHVVAAVYQHTSLSHCTRAAPGLLRHCKQNHSSKPCLFAPDLAGCAVIAQEMRATDIRCVSRFALPSAIPSGKPATLPCSKRTNLHCLLRMPTYTRTSMLTVADASCQRKSANASGRRNRATPHWRPSRVRYKAGNLLGKLLLDQGNQAICPGTEEL